MTWFRFWSRTYVLHLEDEIQWLRARLDQERHRAEVAIDNLLSVRVERPLQATQQPATPETAASTDMDAMIRRLQADPEFAQAGEA